MAAVKSSNLIVFAIVLLLIPVAGFFIWRAYFYFPYETIIPARGVAINSVQAEGEVEAAEWTPISAEVSAEVKEVNATVGQEVKAGDVLISLADDDLQSEIAELQESLKTMDEERQRISEQMKSSTASRLRVRYERLSQDIEQEKAELEAQQSEVEKMKIKSPVDGTFLKTSTVVGKLVSQGVPVAWVGKPKPLRVAMVLDEKQAKGAIIGQKVLLHIAGDGKPQGAAALLSSPSGTLSELLPVNVGGKSMVKARATLPEEAGLEIGNRIKTELVIDQKQDAILLPPAAIKNNMVLVVKFAKVTPVQVIVGATSSDSVEIKAGLYGDEKVIPDIDKFMPPAPSPAPQ